MSDATPSNGDQGTDEAAEPTGQTADVTTPRSAEDEADAARSSNPGADDAAPANSDEAGTDDGAVTEVQPDGTTKVDTTGDAGDGTDEPAQD